MGGMVFFGRASEAAAWRLAGLRAEVAAADDDLAARFAAAAADAALLLVDAATAARLPPALLAAARAADAPLMCVLPAADGSATPDPVVAAARRQLGMDE
jgi:vacuolar-type H+-ATPase subunit F/Vma7